MTTEQTKTTVPPKGSTLFNLLVGALAYSAFGTAAALAWGIAAPLTGLPTVSMLAFLALWWAWIMFFIPNVVLFASISQALKTSAATDAVVEE